MSKNFYEILEVAPTATQEEIKKSYRRLSKQYHPDVNHDPGAESFFKDIQEAYATLSDPHKRAKYDQPATSRSRPESQSFQFSFDGDLSDFFRIFSYASDENINTRTKPSEPIHVYVDLTLEEFHKGVLKHIPYSRLELCKDCRGAGGSNPVKCPGCNGTGVVQIASFVNIPCSVCKGTKTKIENSCQTCHGQGVTKESKTLSAHLTPGLIPDYVLQFREGNIDPKTKQAGLVLVHLRDIPHELYTRDQKNPFDLKFSKTISLTEAMNGTKLQIVSIDQTLIEVSVPPRTSYNSVLKVASLGLANKQSRGDLYIHLSTSFPNQEEITKWTTQ